MKRTKHVLFTFSPYMYKGVEGYLNDQAARGWELVKVGPLGIAKFRRTQRADLKYCADLLTYLRGKDGQEEQREYLALCREGGWELVARRGSLGLFASLPGTDPAPIQTDPDVEWEHYKRAYWNSLLYVAAVILCYAFRLFLHIFVGEGLEELSQSIRFDWLKDWSIAGWLTALPIFCGVALWKTGGFLRNWAYTRQTGAIQVPARWAMWANAVVNLIELMALLLMAAAAVADLIQGGGSVAAVIGMGIGGVTIFFWPSFTDQDEVYPREYRQARIYGASLAVIAVLVIGATWWHGGDTVQFWPENDSFSAYRDTLEQLSVVRETDLGVERGDSYRLSRGIGPAGRYTLLEVALEYGLSELGGAACSRYDCWSPWLAGQVADALREEAATPERLQYRDWVIRDYHGGELTAISLDWADEAWLGSWTNGVEEQGQVLVLRKGSVTVRVVGPVDLTDEDILENIQARLGF